MSKGTEFADTDAITSTCAALGAMDIRFVFSSASDALEKERENYDILCAEYDLAKRCFPNLEVDTHLMFSRNEGLITGPCSGVLDTAYAAKRAALTADRLAQNLDPTNTRGEEGACETRLYTDMAGVEPSRCRIPTDTTVCSLHASSATTIT